MGYERLLVSTACRDHFARIIPYTALDITAAHGDTGFGHEVVELAHRPPAFQVRLAKILESGSDLANA
jgi:hypothetical protein